MQPTQPMQSMQLLMFPELDAAAGRLGQFGQVSPPEGSDPELDRVHAELGRLDPTGDTVARVLRDTLDQLYDGQHSGRWNYDQLRKTEKTHMGTLVEINLHRQFGFDDGDVTDYRIAGIEVDCKYSMSNGGWELPPEVIGQLCLVVTASDADSSWAAGLLRVRESYLRGRPNRDAKRQLSAASRPQVRQLWPAHGRLPENLIAHLEASTRERIFSARAPRGPLHGQARCNELFRSVQRRIIRRAELATVAQQDDFMKRARGNGGARTQLQPEGILVLGHQENDPLVAAALGLPVPQKGEFISGRVVPARDDRDDPVAVIGGERWALARPGDPVFAAPAVPRAGP
jgi:Restriction endonuclease NaeI